jgi:curved DNA-binding protein CbpA
MRFRPEVDYYEALQVHPRASQEMVKKAYRTLMGEMGAHPDLGGDEERAKLINEAYAVLGDPDLRRAYDQARASRMPWGAGGGPASRRWSGPGGRSTGEIEALAAFATKVLLSAVVVVVGMMIARLLENPALDLADLVAAIVVLLRIWGQVAAVGKR